MVGKGTPTETNHRKDRTMSNATQQNAARFIVMTAKAYMPNSCKFGNYRKVAVIETDGVNMPRQIHPNHAAVKRIVWKRDRLNAGKTERSAYYVALAEATRMAAELNGLTTSQAC